MKLDIQAVNDIGCSRTNNEDMMSVGGILLRDSALDIPVEINKDSDSYFYILVSDGMGGHEKGEVASEYLLKCIASYLSDGSVSRRRTPLTCKGGQRHAQRQRHRRKPGAHTGMHSHRSHMDR